MDSTSLSSSPTPTQQKPRNDDPDDDDDEFEIIERDPTGRYIRSSEILLEGPTKTVYKPFDEVDGIEVAWNQIGLPESTFNSSKHLENLSAEADLLKSLKHENVMMHFHSWVDPENKTLNTITELFTSGSLRLYRDKHGHLDKKAIKKWARQILQGLEYLHTHNPPIVHGDLKCENVFVNGNCGTVKIGDLELASVCSSGSPEFMAPELYEEEGCYDHRVDVYSFGMCMLQMVTREVPYSECKNKVQVYKKVLSGAKPDALNRVSDPQVKEFVEKCLAPVDDRLSACDLLKDPFLALDDNNNDDFSVVSNCSCSPLVESVCCNGVHVGQVLKVAVTEMNTFKLSGKIEEDDSVSVTLWIADFKGDAMKIDFVFFLGSDTVVLVTEEMTKELELSPKVAGLVADLLSELVSEIAPDWRAKVCQRVDDSNLGKAPANEEDQGVCEVVASHDQVVECDEREREAECENLDSKDCDNSQFENVRFDQNQRQDDHDGISSELKNGDVHNKGKGTRKSRKVFAVKVFNGCCRKLLYRCRS